VCHAGQECADDGSDTPSEYSDTPERGSVTLAPAQAKPTGEENLYLTDTEQPLPNTIVGGFARGAREGANVVGVGTRRLVMAPIEGAKEGGTIGGVVGLGKGVGSFAGGVLGGALVSTTYVLAGTVNAPATLMRGMSADTHAEPVRGCKPWRTARTHSLSSMCM
jgi:hypothetical protein